jgi:DNA-directed RNA polymerase subunit RPC12/RpoP
MTCPKCHNEIRRADVESMEGVCPECGVRLLRNVSGVMKTSAVMIAAGGEKGFYKSVQDVPEPLRTQLIETTTSQNSGIIVIADKAGKEQLTQVMARREARRAATSIPAESGMDEAAPSRTQSPSPAMHLPWLAWAGFISVLVLAVVLFFLFRTDWSTFQLHW